VTETPVSDVLHALEETLAAVSARVSRGISDAEAIEIIATLERVKRGTAAVQAETTAELATSMRTADAERGVAQDARGGGVGRAVALARCASPHAGGRFVGFADALTREMPQTHAALRAGRIEEWTATGIVRETAFLTAEDRSAVDATLGREFRRPGTSGKRLVDAARALAGELDPAAAVARRKKNEKDRHLSLRPADTGMVWLGALVPTAQGIAAHTHLDHTARAHVNDPDKPLVEGAPDDRTHQQVMADLFLDRLTGRDVVTDTPDITLNVVMTEEAMFRGGEHSASILGHGPIPARHARDLVLDAAEKAQVFVRRLYTSLDGEKLRAVDSHQRLFPPTLATFLKLRDQRCATPFCDAPIRHIDHITPHSRGGATSLDNGQGLCARCNHVKDLHGFRTDHDPVTGVTTTTSPTGHRYPRTPPPVLGHPTLPGPARAGFVVTHLRYLKSDFSPAV
jgi:hypothetical protein